MTDIDVPQSPFDQRARSAAPRRCQTRLRTVLRMNAASSFISGVALAVAPGAIAEVLGVGRPGWVRLVGLALVPFALGVAWSSTTGVHRLRTVTLPIVVGDAGWVLGSAATLALGWYSGTGIALVVAMATLVGTFALMQWTAWRRLGRARQESSVTTGANPSASRTT